MATQVYRISRWSEVFEKSDAGKVKVLTWVSMPVDFGSGYHDMLDEFGDDAPAIYGVWCALVAVAARTPVRGTFANSKGAPFTLSRLARDTHMPAELIQRLLDWASSESVGWLEVVESSEILGNPPKVSEKIPTTRPDLTGPDLTLPAGRLADGRPDSGGGQPEPLRVSAAEVPGLYPTAQRLREAVGVSLGKRDRKLALTAAGLALHRGKAAWLERCIESIRDKSRGSPPERPWGYAKSTLVNEAIRDGWDFHAAMRAAELEQPAGSQTQEATP